MAPPPRTPQQLRSTEAAARLERFARSANKLYLPSIEQEDRSEASLDVPAVVVVAAAGEDFTLHSPALSVAVPSLLPEGRGLEVCEGGEDLEGSVAPSEPTIRGVFTAVATCSFTLVTLNAHMSGLKEDMSYVREDMRKITERMKVAEERISSVEDHMPVISKDLQSVSQTVQKLTSWKTGPAGIIFIWWAYRRGARVRILYRFVKNGCEKCVVPQCSTHFSL